MNPKKRGRPFTSRESRRFPGSVLNQTTLQFEIDATLIRIRPSFHPAGTIRTRSFPAFAPNWCSVRPKTPRLLWLGPHQCGETTLVRDAVAGHRDCIKKTTRCWPRHAAIHLG